MVMDDKDTVQLTPHFFVPSHLQNLQLTPGAVLELVPTKKNALMYGKNWLIKHMDNNHSEHGEDGIIQKIFEVMPPKNKWVCEFGACDPEYLSNTWQLINKQNWQAVLIEGSAKLCENISNYYQDKNKGVKCLNSMVSYEGENTIDKLLAATNAPNDLDLMVIDIDGNDYHIWNSIQRYQANVVIIEFNATIPLDVSFIQPKDMGINQGSSLKAMVELGKSKGYKLIATTAWNAIFVKDQYFSLFFKEEPALEEMYVLPAKHTAQMRLFQFYDGSIFLAPWNNTLWHKVDIRNEDIQVLPKSYRSFSRELAARDYLLEESGKPLPIAAALAPVIEKNNSLKGNVLSRFAKNTYSRYGEDGILEKLLSFTQAKQKFLVEMGAWDGVTLSKSRNLIANHGWQALLCEHNLAAYQALRNNYQGKNNLFICNEKVGGSQRYTLESFLQAAGAPKEFDLLILNTFNIEYQLFQSLTTYQPKIIAIQFNPTIPNDVKFIQANDHEIQQGCSLRALYDLAKLKGYELIGTAIETAFFVRHDLYHALKKELNVPENLDLDDLFHPLAMHAFQLYDGTIGLGGLDYLFWHHLRIDQERLQVIPKSVRLFHGCADADYRKFFYWDHLC